MRIFYTMEQDWSSLGRKLLLRMRHTEADIIHSYLSGHYKGGIAGSLPLTPYIYWYILAFGLTEVLLLEYTKNER